MLPQPPTPLVFLLCINRSVAQTKQLYSIRLLEKPFSGSLLEQMVSMILDFFFPSPLLFLIYEMGSLCYITQIHNAPASASRVMGLQARATTLAWLQLLLVLKLPGWKPPNLSKWPGHILRRGGELRRQMAGTLAACLSPRSICSPFSGRHTCPGCCLFKSQDKPGYFSHRSSFCFRPNNWDSVVRCKALTSWPSALVYAPD